MTCIDCGEPMTPRVDGLPLCDPCLELAVLLCGSGETRVQVLSGARPIEVTA